MNMLSDYNPDVNVQDQHTPIVDYYFTEDLDTSSLVNNESIGDTTVDVPNGTGFISGDILCLKEDGRYYQSEVLSVSTSTNETLTLDTPLDYDFTTSAVVKRCSKELNVNGSSTTKVFCVRPPSGTEWDVTRVILNITDGSPMDSGRFGGISALLNGVVLRKKNKTYHNIFNVKTNGEIAIRMYDVEYDDKAPSGVYGVRARRSFGGQSKNGVVVRLDGDNGDELQVMIQDNLTALTSFEMVAQGHVCDN